METKFCGACELHKELAEFHRRGDKYQSICKECRKELDKQRYLADPERRKQTSKALRKSRSAWAVELKSGKACTDCGNSYHPAAMQWDHTGSDKEYNVSNMGYLGLSKERILREISKCELVCANCHAVRTYNRNNWT